MSQLSKQALKVENQTSFPNNNTNYITPAILRDFNIDMIDSLVDENTYNADSSSWNQQINALEIFTASVAGLNTGSLLLTASATNNVITFTKGDASTFNVTVNTGSGGDISALNQATASLNQFTQSANIRLNNLESTTASINSSITQLNASSASQQVSINALNTFTASQSTASIVTSITNLNSFTSSANVRLSNLETTTASLNTSVSNLNGFSASALSSISQLNVSSASQQVSINSINARTGSYLTTGSVSGSQSTFGGFNMNMMYTSSFGQAAVTSSAGYVYFDYSIFNQPQMQFWTTSDGQTFVDAGQVRISGSSVSNQPISLNFDYQDFGVGIPVTGSGVNGATYTLTGPYYHDLTITGSVTSVYQQQVIGLDGRKTVQDANGIYGLTAFGDVQSGLSVNQGLYAGDNVNGNYVGLAATSSQVASQSGPTSIDKGQIWANQNNQGAFTQISFQGNSDYTDGRITSHQSFSISGSKQLLLPTGSNQQVGTATLNGGNPGTVTVSNSLVTANSIIMLTKQSLAHNGAPAVTAKNGGSFTITSTANGDNDTVAWFIINNS